MMTILVPKGGPGAKAFQTAAAAAVATDARAIRENGKINFAAAAAVSRPFFSWRPVVQSGGKISSSRLGDRHGPCRIIFLFSIYIR